MSVCAKCVDYCVVCGEETKQSLLSTVSLCTKCKKNGTKCVKCGTSIGTGKKSIAKACRKCSKTSANTCAKCGGKK